MTLNKLIASKRSEVANLLAEAEAIVNISETENRDITAEEKSRIDEITGDKGLLNSIGAEIETLEKRLATIDRAKTVMSKRLDEHIESHSPNVTNKVPAKARGGGSLKGFKGAEAEFDAYASGKFLMATIGNHQGSQQWCKERGIDVRNAMSESDDLKGGVLVPAQMETAIINLKEEYGVFGQLCRNVPMTSDTISVPRRVSGVTAYAVGEAAEITASDATLGQISLTARKFGTMTRISSELSEDAIISIADFIVQEIAYAHAVKEDSCGFSGDGTSTYHGITGLVNALAAGSVATATGHTTMATLTLDDLEAAVAKLPMFPGIMPRWIMNSAVYWQTGARLQLAAGGVTTQMVAGGPQLQLLGYPVTFAQTMSSAPTTGLTYAYFGDMNMAATKGSRRGVTIAADNSRYFEYDQVAIRSTLRYDINIHEVGTASAAGPILQCKLG